MASVLWDTTDFGPPTASSLRPWRIYVVLDPDDSLTEIHEGTTGWNQNNEGWGYAAVQRAAVLGDPLDVPPADVFLDSDALAVIRTVGRRQLVQTSASATRAGEPVRLRVRVGANRTTGDAYQLLVYDGDPAAAGQLIAAKLVRGIDSINGTLVWISWTPTERGKHVVHAILTEALDDPNPGNAVDTLPIQVHP